MDVIAICKTLIADNVNRPTYLTLMIIYERQYLNLPNLIALKWVYAQFEKLWLSSCKVLFFETIWAVHMEVHPKVTTFRFELESLSDDNKSISTIRLVFMVIIIITFTSALHTIQPITFYLLWVTTIKNTHFTQIYLRKYLAHTLINQKSKIKVMVVTTMCKKIEVMRGSFIRITCDGHHKGDPSPS